MKQYRLSKYNPEYRDHNGIYRKDEWTSYSDIQKSYDGEEFARAEYLEIEEKYCNAITAILKAQKTRYVRIKNLEKSFSLKDVERDFLNRGLDITDEERRIIEEVGENQIISIQSVNQYIKLLLRECFWCVLADVEHGISIETGYDYYVHITCNSIDPSMILSFQKQGIYVEEYGIITPET